MTVDELIDMLTSMKVHGRTTGDHAVKTSDGKLLREITGVICSDYSDSIYLVKEKRDVCI